MSPLAFVLTWIGGYLFLRFYRRVPNGPAILITVILLFILDGLVEIIRSFVG